VNKPATDFLIVLAAGGTGGHVFPAEALASALEARGRKLALITDRRGTKYGGALSRIERHEIRAGSPVARGPMARGIGALNLLRGIGEARRVLRRISPDVVVGFGGYPSVPPVIAASRLGITCIIHEQNAVLGRANRLLAGRAAAIATSFPDTAMIKSGLRDRARQVGNPVRAEIVALRDVPYRAPENDEPIELLVTGGSQGARAFSTLVPAALGLLEPDLRARLRVAAQCRAEDLMATRARYSALDIQAKLVSFFDDMPARLAAAHVVIARAGASTIAELAVSGRPAVLIPYPSATDDHQTANARAMEQAGGAALVPENGDAPKLIAQALTGWFSSAGRLASAAGAAHGFGRPDAANALADLVMAQIPNGNSRTSGVREAA